jgi:hypothetical protein
MTRPRAALLLAPSFYCSAICGFAFWGVLVNYRHLPHGIIFLHLVFATLAAFFLGMLLARRFGGSWYENSLPWVAALGYVSVAVGVNCNVLFFHLLAKVYYPYPHPDHPDLRFFLVYTAPAAFGAICAAMGGRAFSCLAPPEHRRRDISLGALGFGVGLFAANVVVAVSWIAALFSSLGLLALIAPRSRAGVAAALALVAVAFGLHTRQPDLTYVGSLQDARLAAQVDSPYTRSHFYTFADGKCVALASGFHMITYNCLDADRLPRGLNYLFRALVGGLPSYRALVVGRSLGMYPNLLLAVNPNAELIQTAEFDRNQAAAVEQTFDRLTVAPENRARIKYFSGDLARFVLAQRGKYDVIFYNGIGLSQYQIPFAFPYQEQSLFTSKVLEHLFDEVLDPHGALVFDWGGRALDEQAFMRAVLPKGVYSGAFWYVLTEPPFTGMPLTYVVASRDPQLIARVRDHLSRASYFKDISDVQGVSRPIPWNRPYLRREIVIIQLIFLATVALLFFAGLLVLHFRPTFLIPSRMMAPPWLAGAAAVCWFVDAAAHQSRQMVGYGYAWPVMALAFFGALAGGMQAPPRLWRRWLGKIALTAGVALSFVLSAADLTGPPALAPVLLGGLLAGVCWGMTVDAGNRLVVPALFGGVVVGFAADLAAAFFVGFNGGVVLACVLALIVIYEAKGEGLVLSNGGAVKQS